VSTAAEPPVPAAGLSWYAGCRDAEDWFAALDVPYDPQVLAVGRLHVLRLFGRELRTVDAGAPGALRAALERSYQALVDAGPLDHRVFKVLRDRAPRQFVPVTLAVEGEGDD
jgi:nitrogenase-stabilizing/protective protein